MHHWTRPIATVKVFFSEIDRYTETLKSLGRNKVNELRVFLFEERKFCTYFHTAESLSVFRISSIFTIPEKLCSGTSRQLGNSCNELNLAEEDKIRLLNI